jgi:hypothetical protein
MLHQNNQRNDKEDQLPVNTKAHTNKDKLLGLFLSRNPFPSMRTTQGQYYSLYYGGNRKSLKRVMQRRIERKCLEPPGNQQHGLFYWFFELTDKRREYQMDDVDDLGVLLGRHGSNKQGVYTVVWKNWSMDMFGTYDFWQEVVLNPIIGGPSMVTGSTQMIPEQPILPWPFVYTKKEYYNDTSIAFKTEEHSDSDSDARL